MNTSFCDGCIHWIRANGAFGTHFHYCERFGISFYARKSRCFARYKETEE